MVKGRKVYDPIDGTWSTGYWIPVYNRNGRVEYYVPVWREIKKRKEVNHV